MYKRQAQYSAATWTAIIALPDLGLASAAGYGIDLTRVALADTPGVHWPEVVTTLAGAFQAVLLGDVGPITPKLAARLAAHLRRTGAILLTTAPFPGAQHRLTVTHRRWDGLGAGHGQLLRRHVTVQATGRGMATARPRTAHLLLPDESGRAAVAETVSGLRSVPDDQDLAAAI